MRVIRVSTFRGHVQHSSMLKAQEKLKEAKFFLEKMRESHGSSKEFDYYLNAFVGSCRSIQWVLSSQFNKDESLKAWLERQQPTDEEINILKSTNDLRIRSTKKESVTTDKKAFFAIDPSQLSHLPKEEYNRLKEAIETGDFTGIEIRLHQKDEGYSIDNPPQGRNFLPISRSIAVREVSEFPRQDILDVSEKYYTAMESLVLKAIARVSQNA